MISYMISLDPSVPASRGTEPGTAQFVRTVGQLVEKALSNSG
jgi:hypothetical protein